jgi:putative ABC transport system substrate-binding protein
MIWTPAEANSEVATKIARDVSKQLGIELVEQTVASADEVLPAAQSLLTKNIDVFFVSTDSTVVSALESIVKVANENRKPLFGNDPASASRGAVAALGIDYDDQGYESGQMAARILKGESAKSIAIEMSKKGYLAVNTRAAELQGVKLPDDTLKQAKETYNDITPPKKP